MSKNAEAFRKLVWDAVKQRRGYPPIRRLFRLFMYTDQYKGTESLGHPRAAEDAADLYGEFESEERQKESAKPSVEIAGPNASELALASILAVEASHREDVERFRRRYLSEGLVRV